MKIHFVCTGNTFRSRLAEAYLKSKNISGLEVSSSGIHADVNYNGPVCYYTVHLLGESNLIKYLKEHWTLTTKEELEKQDLVVFMHKEHYDFCFNKLHAKIPNFQLWDVPDLEEYLPGVPIDTDGIARVTEKIFEEIKTNIDQKIVEEVSN